MVVFMSETESSEPAQKALDRRAFKALAERARELYPEPTDATQQKPATTSFTVVIDVVANQVRMPIVPMHCRKGPVPLAFVQRALQGAAEEIAKQEF